MSATQANCFQIVGSELLTGIPFREVPPHFCIDVGGVQNFRILPPQQFSRGERRIMNAAAGKDPEHGFSLDCRMRGKNCCLLVFYVPDLDFRGCFCEGFNFWPGGEWQGHEPLRRVVRYPTSSNPRAELDKVELWLIKDGEKILIGDCRSGIRIFSFENGQAQLSTPDRTVMINYLQNSPRTFPKGECWKRHSLSALCGRARF